MNTIVTLHSGALGMEANSQDYLEIAARMKPDVVEVDLRLTSDDITILNHDPAIKVDGKSYEIKDYPLNRLRDLKPELMTLDDALKFCHSRKLFMNLDLKTSHAIDSAVRVIKKRNMAREILFSGCYRDEIIYLRDHLPDLRVLLNVENDELALEGEAYLEAASRIVYRASELGCCGLNVNYKYCRPELVQYARTRSMPLMVWTIDEEQEMRRFIDLGVYSITTNRIDLFHKILNEKRAETRFPL